MKKLEDLMPKKNSWLECMYTEAWKQYCHEDNLGQSRTNFFLGTQAALITISTFLLADSAKYLVKLERVEGISCSFHVGFALLGLIIVIIGSFLLLVASHWKNVTEAGGLYVKFRRIQLTVMEKLAGASAIGLAQLEQDWMDFSEAAHVKEKHYRPYKDCACEGLKAVRIERLPKSQGLGSGWMSMLKVIIWWQWFCRVVVAVGVVFLISSFLGAGG